VKEEGAVKEEAVKKEAAGAGAMGSEKHAEFKQEKGERERERPGPCSRERERMHLTAHARGERREGGEGGCGRAGGGGGEGGSGGRGEGGWKGGGGEGGARGGDGGENKCGAEGARGGRCTSASSEYFQRRDGVGKIGGSRRPSSSRRRDAGEGGRGGGGKEGDVTSSRVAAPRKPPPPPPSDSDAWCPEAGSGSRRGGVVAGGANKGAREGRRGSPGSPVPVPVCRLSAEISGLLREPIGGGGARRASPLMLQLIEAAAKGNWNKGNKSVEKLLQKNIDWKDFFAFDSDGDTVLHAAILEGSKHKHSVDIVKALLTHLNSIPRIGPQLAKELANTPTDDKELRQSPLILLMTGAAHRDEELADTERAFKLGNLLLDHGANPLYKDKEGNWTFLHWAVGMTEDEDGESTPPWQVSRTATLLSHLFQHECLCGVSEQLIFAEDKKGRTAMDVMLLNQDHNMSPVFDFLLRAVSRARALAYLTDSIKKRIIGGNKRVLGPGSQAPGETVYDTRIEYLRETSKSNVCQRNLSAGKHSSPLLSVAQSFLDEQPP
jgi:hypothetical protein